MRLNKYLAQAGVASRRKCDDLIFEGIVTINGKIMNAPAYQVTSDDVVKVSRKRIEHRSQLIYLVLNKLFLYEP